MYKQYNKKPLKTWEFRAKDFFVRSARSFERLEMQILCKRIRDILNKL